MRAPETHGRSLAPQLEHRHRGENRGALVSSPLDMIAINALWATTSDSVAQNAHNLIAMQPEDQSVELTAWSKSPS